MDMARNMLSRLRFAGSQTRLADAAAFLQHHSQARFVAVRQQVHTFALAPVAGDIELDTLPDSSRPGRADNVIRQGCGEIQIGKNIFLLESNSLVLFILPILDH